MPSTIACGPALAVLGTDPHGPVSAMAEVEQPGREVRFLGQNCGHRDDGDESCGRLTANRRAVYVALAKGKDWGPGWQVSEACGAGSGCQENLLKLESTKTEALPAGQ